MSFPNKLKVQRDTGGWPELVCLGMGLVAQVVRYEDAVFIADVCNAQLAASSVRAVMYDVNDQNNITDGYLSKITSVSVAAQAPSDKINNEQRVASLLCSVPALSAHRANALAFDIDAIYRAAPSPTRESLNEKPCVGCNGAGVIGTPGMPCPFCPVEKKLREFEAALATPRQTEDGGLSAAEIDDMCFGYAPSGKIGELRELLNAHRQRLASTFAPKEPAAQGGVPEAEPVAWIRKTDITELTDSEPETNGWTALYAAPTGASK